MIREADKGWRELHDGLRAFIARRVGNDADVEDILQEVFLRIQRRLDTLRDLRRLVPWIFQITRHAIVDHYRSPARRREFPVGLSSELDEVYPVADISSPSALSETPRQVLATCLRPMVERLPERYREAVMLVEFQGLSQAAAAERLGVSVSGMKSRIQRGRKALRQMLERCCAVELDRRKGIAAYTPRSGAQSCDCSSSA